MEYRADWEINDEVKYFFGTREQCMRKARYMSKKRNDYRDYITAYCVASDEDGLDLGAVAFHGGIISHKDGIKI